jgi:hypothetical protein
LALNLTTSITSTSIGDGFIQTTNASLCTATQSMYTQLKGFYTITGNVYTGTMLNVCSVVTTTDTNLVISEYNLTAIRIG